MQNIKIDAEKVSAVVVEIGVVLMLMVVVLIFVLLFAIVSGHNQCCQAPREWTLNQVSAGSSIREY
jgi:hypothetical protein